MTKKHCDICDTTPASDILNKNVSIERNGIVHALTVTVVVRKRYHKGEGEDSENRLELCAECQRKAIEATL